MFEELFGSQIRMKLLGWIMTHPDQEFYVREMGALIKEDPTNVSRELARLTTMGIVQSQKQGVQKYYTVNKECPFYSDLRGLIIKTVGIGDTVRSALAPFAEHVDFAFIFGSFAKEKETAQSDLDLFIIGELSSREAADFLGPLGKTLGREINPVIYSPEEFHTKLEEENHFIKEVMAGKKIFMIGNEDELNKLVESKTI